MHNYLVPDSREFYFRWRQPCRLHWKNFAGDTPASTDSLSASSFAAFFVARPFEQNAVAGIDGAGIV
jgi:hypothetical protein